MYNLYERALQKYDVFNDSIPEIVNSIANSIPNKSIPLRMKQAIAITEIIKFTSQFHIHIKHWNDSLIPINAITFCIASSGAGKDSSVSSAKKCFKDGYEIIEELRIKEAKSTAIELARKEGISDPEEWSSYKDFLNTVNPLTIGISTIEGLLLHLHELSVSSLGSGYIYTGKHFCSSI